MGRSGRAARSPDPWLLAGTDGARPVAGGDDNPDPADPVVQVPGTTFRPFLDRLNELVPGLPRPAHRSPVGKTPAGRARPRRSRSARTFLSRSTKQQPPACRRKERPVPGAHRPVKSLPPNRGACTRCTVTSGSGAPTGYGDYPEGPQINLPGPGGLPPRAARRGHGTSASSARCQPRLVRAGLPLFNLASALPQVKARPGRAGGVVARTEQAQTSAPAGLQAATTAGGDASADRV